MNRILPIQHPYHSSLGIGFYFLDTRVAMQRGFMRLLDAHAPNVCGGPITLWAQALGVIDVDASDITQDVGKHLAIRIVTGEVGLNVHTRQSVPMGGQTRDRFWLEIVFQWNGLKSARPLPLTLKSNSIVLAQTNQIIDGCQSRL